MDSTDLSEDSIHEVGVLFEAALRAAAGAMRTDDLAGLERRLHAVGRGGLGAGGGTGAGSTGGA